MSEQPIPDTGFEINSDYEAFEEEFASAAASEDLAEIRPLPRISMQAFCTSPDILNVIDSVAHDRRLARVHVKAVSGGIPAATEFFYEAPTPNLIILEAPQNYEQLIEELDELANVCDAGTKVVLIGHVNDVHVYRDLVRRGVSEYVVAPVAANDLITVLSELYNDPQAEPLGRTIAFIGAKGGVGSSTIAHNIGWSISHHQVQDVIVADFDVPFGTAGLDFNQDPPQTIADAIKAADRLDDQYLERILSKCGERLSLLSAPAVLDQTTDFDGEFFNHMVELLQQSAPYTVLDLPHLWTEWNKQLLLSADDIVVTAQPDLANLRNVKNLLDLINQERSGDRPPHLVINQTGVQKRPEIKAKDFAGALDYENFAEIPFDASIFGMAANNGQMIGEMSGAKKMAEVFDALAGNLTGRLEVQKQSKSLLGPLLERFKKTK
ncbi:MAG: AAA family ATPase [Cohaesibacter sp.]|jgi:pilus assembly protein CpaE|nr:AAA family ATPase [Cohaesibacter sp.]